MRIDLSSPLPVFFQFARRRCSSQTPQLKPQKLQQLYSHPSCEFAAVATRFALPPRSLAFSPDGCTLAAGGDDEGIKVISLSSSAAAAGDGGDGNEDKPALDLSKPRVLRTLPAPPYTRGLAWDPEGVYLASVDASGSVTVWERASADPSTNSAAPSAARPEVVLRRVAPKIDAGGAARSPVAWHPDCGSLLAVAGAEPGEVLLFERLSWAPAAAGSGDDGALRGAHGNSPVRVLSFSPNGLYLLSGDASGGLAVWDVSSARRRVIARARIGGGGSAAALSAAAWKPEGNEVSVVDESGAVAVWRSPLPESVPGPTADPEAVLAAADAAAGATTKMTGGATTATEEDDDDAADLSDGEEEETGDEMEEDGDGRSTRPPLSHRPALPHTTSGQQRQHLNNSKRRSLPRVASHIPQAPIAPGSTKPDRIGGSFSSASSCGRGHRWLAYNSLGCVSSRRGDGCAVVEVSLHDRSPAAASRAWGGRVPLLTDFFGFDLAALGPRGLFYAAPPADDGSDRRRRGGRRGGGRDDDGDDGGDDDADGSEDDSPRGVLVFRPFAGWAGGGGWTADLPRGKRAVCLAAGPTFAAAATSPDRCLRLFSPAGLQTAVSTLPGEPVALAAPSGSSPPSLLAAVWHGPAPSDPGDQSLVVAVLDGSPVHGDDGSGSAANGPLAAVAAAAPLPLSEGASLTWLGFSDNGNGCLLGSFDSKGVMRVRPAVDAGAPWTPVFDARRTGAGGKRVGARYWPVGFTSDKLHCVVIANSSRSSSSSSAAAGPGERPVVSVEPLRAPTLLLAGEATAAGGEEAGAAAASAAADLADASLRAGVFLHGVRASVAAGVSASAAPSLEEGGEEASAELAIAAAEAAADRALLRAFHASLKSRALERALEAAGRLSLTRSLEGALKLANHHRVPALAERVSALLSARLEMESAISNAAAAAGAAAEGGNNNNGTPTRNFGASPAAAALAGGGGAEGNPFMRSSSGAATAPLAARDSNAASASAPPPPPKFSAPSAEKRAAPSPAKEGKYAAAAAAVNPFLRKVKQPRA